MCGDNKWYPFTKADGSGPIMLNLTLAYRAEPAEAPQVGSVIWFQTDPPIGVAQTFDVVQYLLTK